MKRVVTAVALLPILIIWIIYGKGIGLAVLVGIASGIGLREYYKITLPPHQGALRLPGVAAGALAIAVLHIFGVNSLGPALFILFAMFSLLMLVSFNPQARSSEGLATAVAGLIYIPFMLSHLMLLRLDQDGALWVLFVMCVVFSLDTGAYYIGTWVGKHLLCPTISPKKTWEGTIAGLACALATGIFFKIFFLARLDMFHAVMLSIVIAVFGVLGDLVESMIKRSANVKDSGRLLPGHGGLLDRIDSLLFAAPLVYYYKIWLIQ
ncbi:MAG: phosphatidate cytidylyltransferase [Pseudomonadota bacterium]